MTNRPIPEVLPHQSSWPGVSGPPIAARESKSTPAGISVVKLGGSHALSPLLKHWLTLIARTPGQTVLVPGGGPFADAIRLAQPTMGFDDDTAHDMALMAMAQYGRALTNLAKGFTYADTLEAVRDAIAHEQTPIWSPWPMLRAHPDIPRSWDVTSDSLAVWLATTLNARRVILIKHRTTPETDLVDPAFPHFTARFSGTVQIAGPDDLTTLFSGRSAATA